MHHRRRMYYMPRATEPLGASFASTSTSATVTMVPNHSSKELSSTSKAIIGSVTSCLGVAILISESLSLSVDRSELHYPLIILQALGVYLYGRRRHRYSTENASIVFHKDVFAKSASSPQIDKYTMVDFSKLSSSSTLSPVRYRESSSTISNADEDKKMTIPTLAFPTPIAKKERKPRCKPTWLSPIATGEEVRLAPITYSTSNAGQEILIPIPLRRPSQMSEAIPMSPMSPVTCQSFASMKPKTPRQSLIIPDFEPLSVVSPTRSESFAPKDLDLPSSLPTPASFTSVLNSTGSQIASSPFEHDKDVEPPRLMSVVALFTPNLPDELHIKVGDTICIIEEYKDGWCFAQILGKKDAPKGVVPLVCLQERKRFTHSSLNKSLTSLDWR